MIVYRVKSTRLRNNGGARIPKAQIPRWRESGAMPQRPAAAPKAVNYPLPVASSAVDFKVEENTLQSIIIIGLLSISAAFRLTTMRVTLISLLQLILFLQVVEAKRTFWVSTKGSDTSGNGSFVSPWATFGYAVVSLRQFLPSMNSDISVFFESGHYTLSSAVILSQNDSGRNGFNVVYSGATGNSSDVIFDGGQPLSDWVEVGATGIFSASLPCVTREVYAFQERVAESPMLGVNLTSANTLLTPLGYITTDATLIAAVTASDTLVLASDVELLYTSAAAQWQESRARVNEMNLINSTALNITMLQPGWDLVRGKAYAEKFPTAILNAFVPSVLTYGQGVISLSRKSIFYRPPLIAGNSMVNANAWVGGVDGELLLLAGVKSSVSESSPSQSLSPLASSEFIHNIRIENMTFQGSTWLAPTTEGAYAPDQGGIVYRAVDLPGPLDGHAIHPVPASITVRTGANISLMNIAVLHVGGTGIAVEDGSQDVAIIRVNVFDAGCSGVRLGQVDDASFTDPSTFNTRLTLTDSVLSTLAQGYRDCSGVFGGYVSSTIVAYNNITDCNWAGLTLGWGGWGVCSYRPVLGGNRILGNFISRVNLIVGDGGPIYVMSKQPASVSCGALDLTCRSEMAYNYVSYAIHHAAMLYHDEGTGYYYTHDNVVLQPILTDPHGWWWSWAAAWASTEENILITNNWAQGVNRSDMAAGHNLVLANNTLLSWDDAWPKAAQDIINNAGPRR